MVKLKGLSIKSKDNPHGDISIIYTGLRPGEKLFEELLCDGISIATKHPLVFTTKKDYLNNNFNIILDELIYSLERYDIQKTKDQLAKLIPEWKPSKDFNQLEK